MCLLNYFHQLRVEHLLPPMQALHVALAVPEGCLGYVLPVLALMLQHSRSQLSVLRGSPLATLLVARHRTDRHAHNTRTAPNNNQHRAARSRNSAPLTLLYRVTRLSDG